jgi:hypothetical protein
MKGIHQKPDFAARGGISYYKHINITYLKLMW